MFSNFWPKTLTTTWKSSARFSISDPVFPKKISFILSILWKNDNYTQRIKKAFGETLIRNFANFQNNNRFYITMQESKIHNRPVCLNISIYSWQCYNSFLYLFSSLSKYCPKTVIWFCIESSISTFLFKLGKDEHLTCQGSYYSLYRFLIFGSFMSPVISPS